MIDTRQHTWLGVEPLRESFLETLNNFTSRTEMATDKACSALTQAAEHVALFYDAHSRGAPLYEIGDKVWLNSQNIMTMRPTRKLDHKWLGPYPIKKVILWNAYCLKLPLSFGQTHLVFLVTLLRPYNADTIAEHVQCNPPPPIVCDRVEEFEVECILDS